MTMCDIFIPEIYVLSISLLLKHRMLVSRNWLQKYFDNELPNADELVDLFNTHAFEIEGLDKADKDSVIDVDVLPNRSSDCLCHRGIARDIATIISRPMKRDPLRENIPSWESPSDFSVTVENTELCPRYMAGIIRGVKVGPSPEWLKTALESMGQKSINNIVDITNYIMFDIGQPAHVFDLSLLEKDEKGNRNITVRFAKKDEKITVLTGEEYTLNETNQIIADGVSGTPLAIAGIKGGKHAEVTEETVDVVVEVANFDFVNIRNTSKQIKLQTDASLRFQNEPSERLPAFAMREAIMLFEEVTGGKLVGVADAYDGSSENKPIDVTLTEINNLLGLNLSLEEVEKILIRFEWEFSRDGEEFAVTGPWERTDINIKQDIIEEIGRMYGYKNIKSKLLSEIDGDVKVNKNLYYSEKMQNALKKMGYSEVLTYTMVDKGMVEIKNPFASDKSFMRMDLSFGMNKALDLNAKNAPVLGLKEVKLFEIGTVFTKKAEELHLCVGVRAISRKQGKAEKELENDVKEVLNILDIKSNVKIVNGVCEIPLDNAINILQEPKSYELPHKWDTEARFKMWSVYPFVSRDIAVWVPKGTKNEEVLSEIIGEATDLLVHHGLFDEFEKDEKKSYAWHLIFQSKDRTLTDTEIGDIMDKITAKINSKKGWEVR